MRVQLQVLLFLAAGGILLVLAAGDALAVPAPKPAPSGIDALYRNLARRMFCPPNGGLRSPDGTRGPLTGKQAPVSECLWDGDRADALVWSVEAARLFVSSIVHTTRSPNLAGALLLLPGPWRHAAVPYLPYVWPASIPALSPDGPFANLPWPAFPQVVIPLF